MHSFQKSQEEHNTVLKGIHRGHVEIRAEYLDNGRGN